MSEILLNPRDKSGEESDPRLIRVSLDKDMGQSVHTATESFFTNRSLESSLEELGISIDDLKGRVLDLGSGQVEQFAREAKDHGIDVYSLSAHLVSSVERHKRKVEYSKSSDLQPLEHQPIAALGQSLPLKSSSFKTIVGVYSVLNWAKKEDYEQIFGEINRVLTDDGKAYLGPIFVQDSPWLNPRTREIAYALNQLNIPFSFKLATENHYTVVLSKRVEQ